MTTQNSNTCPVRSTNNSPPPAGAVHTCSCNGKTTWNTQGINLAVGMCVCVVGGGNIAAATASWLGRSDKNLCVHVLTRQPDKWLHNIKVRANPECRWGAMKPYETAINLITDDPAKAIPHASMVMIAAPAHVHFALLQKIAPHLRPGAVLGTVFAQGGFDWAVQKALGEKQSQLSGIFGLQHVPWLARWEEHGKAVEIIGPKEFLCAAVSPPCARTSVQLLLQLCFDQPCKLLPNFLCLTLTPSNQIIHPARYYAIFKDWDGVRAYKQDEISWGLYTEFDAEAARHLEQLDAELQNIKKAIIKKCPQIDLSTVMPIQERIILQYGDDVKDRSNLQMVVSSNKGYASCRTPAVAVPGGFHPAVQGRLFQEDVPSGLCVLKNIAEIFGVETPCIDMMIEWHQRFMGIEFIKNNKLNKSVIDKTTGPSAYGIDTAEQLVATVLRGCDGGAH